MSGPRMAPGGPSQAQSGIDDEAAMHLAVQGAGLTGRRCLHGLRLDRLGWEGRCRAAVGRERVGHRTGLLV